MFKDLPVCWESYHHKKQNNLNLIEVQESPGFQTHSIVRRSRNGEEHTSSKDLRIQNFLRHTGLEIKGHAALAPPPLHLPPFKPTYFAIYDVEQHWRPWWRSAVQPVLSPESTSKVYCIVTVYLK